MKYYLLFLVFISAIYVNAQDSKARSKPGALFQKKLVEQTEPEKKDTVKQEITLAGFIYEVPYLTASIEFTEISGNNVLDAGETGKILLTIKNEGAKTAQNCILKIEPVSSQPDIVLQYNSQLGNIISGTVTEVEILLTASNNIGSGQTKFSLNIIEENGFDLDPAKIISILSREYQPPQNVVVDFGIVDASRNSKVEKFEVVDVVFRIQNKGETSSLNTYAQILLGENVVNMDVPERFDIGEIKPGEFKDITAKIATNARTKEVNLVVNIYEETGKYTSNSSFQLPFNVIQKGAEEILFAATETSRLDIPEVAKLDFSLADSIPVASQKKERAVAVIIGNKNYHDQTVPAVEYAWNDATLMKNYVIQTLGYEPENILYYQDATQAIFNTVFGQPNDFKGKLYDYAVNGNEIFVYYSGHGAPNPDNKEGYIVPVDCDPNKVRLNGYSLATLFSNLDKIAFEKKLNNVTVVLESCFSGNSQSGSLLTNISPIYINIKNHTMTYPNSTVFTSTSGNEVSTWHNEKKQSLFTYYFLKGLKGDADSNKDSVITAKELYDFIADVDKGVPYWSRRLNKFEQHPTFWGRDYEIYKQ